MWKLAFILLIAFAIWKFYPSFTHVDVKNVEQNALNSVKSEKTIYGVQSGRERANKDAQEVIDRY